MVRYDDQALSHTFAALADPTRRALLARLGELAEPFPMSLPAVMKHLDVLSDAGLVKRTKQGRTVSCSLAPEPMREAMDWLARYQRFWSASLDRLAELLEGENPRDASRKQGDKT
jgi:DNA-binding transcriptional ArsR family regulator